MEAVLAYRLTDKNLTTMEIGYFFSIFPCCYLVSTLLGQYLPKKIDKRVIMIIAMILNGFSYFLVGPS